MAVNAKGHIAVDGAMPNAVVKKPAQKKATMKLKPKSEEVIDISFDAEEVKKEKHVVNKEKTEQQSLKNKAPTLISTLTARSKVDFRCVWLFKKWCFFFYFHLISDFILQASCGLNYKPNERIVDINSADVNNDLAVVEYVDEIYKFYKLVEVENMVYFLAEFCVMNYATVVYCPSVIAASAIYTARCTLNKAPSISTSGPSYSRSDLRLLLGILGAPLSPVHISNNDPLPPEEDEIFFFIRTEKQKLQDVAGHFQQ
ncbi:G2/mitotic-specific cyclin S13-6 [Abeliophyllum distichum]|uniref:G2/mitotic-specific cyclin S13-6 n=1 Tax=Abeliophyllum distichum TaxID=126358 RepID=A0ABD1Q7B1_9LAMI